MNLESFANATAATIKREIDASRAELQRLEDENHDDRYIASRGRRDELVAMIEELNRLHTRAANREKETLLTETRAKIAEEEALAAAPLPIDRLSMRAIEATKAAIESYRELQAAVKSRHEANGRAQRLERSIGEQVRPTPVSGEFGAVTKIRQAVGAYLNKERIPFQDAKSAVEMLSPLTGGSLPKSFSVTTTEAEEPC